MNKTFEEQILDKSCEYALKKYPFLCGRGSVAAGQDFRDGAQFARRITLEQAQVLVEAMDHFIEADYSVGGVFDLTVLREALCKFKEECR